jgi:DNA-directed RNA polymerase subunit RPC12/RpoP
MANFYCEYCGKKYPSVLNLTSVTCHRHPLGSNRGKHKLYEGSEKAKYTCKYCGKEYPSLINLTSVSCHRHPNGSNKGKHSPTL